MVAHTGSWPLIQGLVLTGDPVKAKKIGVVIHILVMGTVMFGLAYAAAFVVLDDVGILTGASLGLVHGVVAGVAMAGMGSMHPRMDAPVSSGQQPVVTQDGRQVRLLEPGLFDKNYGPLTPLGLVIGHVVYGLVVALVYSAAT
jgi:hypothetical protein